MERIQKKKRSAYIIIAEIFMFLTIAAIIFTVIWIPSTGTLNLSVGVETYNDNWKMIEEKDLGDGTSLQITTDVTKSMLGKEFEKEKIILVNTCDFIDEYNSIGFATYYNYVKVLINDEVIYTYGYEEKLINDFDEGGNMVEYTSYTKQSGMIGNLYAIVHMPNGVKSTDTIKIVLESEDIIPSIYFYGFDVGNETRLLLNQIYSALIVLLALLLGIVGFIVLICFKSSKRTRHFVDISYFCFVNFVIVLAIWEILDSQLLNIMGFPAGAVSFASFEVYMLIAFPWLQFIQSMSKWSKVQKIINICLLVLSVINFVAVNYAYFMGIHTFMYMIYSTHLVIILSLFAGLVESFVNLFATLNKKNKDNDIGRQKKTYAALALAVTVFCIFVALQFFEFFMNPSSVNTEYLKYGLIAFGLLSIFSIIVTVNDDVERERKASHDKLWEEKSKVEEARLIMRDAFKTIIPEKYIDEVVATYRKRRELQKNNPDMDFSGEEMILKIGQDKIKDATILVSDVRGFSEISSKLDANRLGDMLNHYLGSMTDIVEKYGGHVLEFMGDGILAGFGTIEADDYNADKAVKAAIEMQLMMPDINAWNESHGFPNHMEIGVGINTGEVFAGIIGSVEKFKFDVLGKEVNLASRIESFTFGGQILISESTKQRIHENIGVYDKIVAQPKGFDLAMTYYQITGIGDLCLPVKKEVFTFFTNPINVKFNVFEDKGNQEKTRNGRVIAVCDTAIIMETKAQLGLYDIVKVIHNGGVTCKVASIRDDGYVLRFTSTARRNDGQAIFVEEVPDNPALEGLDKETRKLMKEKKENYNF